MSKTLLVLLGMEMLVLLLSVVLGLFLYLGKQPLTLITPASLNNTINQTSVFILFLLLSPGLFYYINNSLKHQKWLKEIMLSAVIATIAMGIMYLSINPLNSQGIFVIAVLSASSGMIVSKALLLYQRWRFLVHSGMNQTKQ